MVVLAPEGSDATQYLGAVGAENVEVLGCRMDEPLDTASAVFRVLVDRRSSHLIIGDAGALRLFRYFPAPFVPYSIVVHGTEVWDEVDPVRSRLPERQRRRLARLHRGAELTLLNSKATGRLLQVAGIRPRRPTVLHPICWIPPELGDAEQNVREIRRRYGFADHAFVILSVGRLAVDKGHETLLRAFAVVASRLDEARLLIVGDGALRHRLEHLTDDLRLGRKVIFAGDVPDAELSVHFAACDIFALLSSCRDRFEGFGLVFLEAAAHGLAVVATRAGGVPEAVVDGSTGYLVDPEAPGQAAAAILALAEDGAKRMAMAERARRRVDQDFSPVSMARRLDGSGLVAMTRRRRLDPGRWALWLVKLTWWRLRNR